MTATNPDGTTHTWNLLADRHTYRQLIHMQAGDRISVPYLGSATVPNRSELAFFEVRGDMIRADRFDWPLIGKGMIESGKLPAGDYDLYLKRSGEKIRIRVAEGSVHDGYVLNNVRHLEMAALVPLQIETITADKDTLTVKLNNPKYALAFTSRHAVSPGGSPRREPGAPRDSEPEGSYPLQADLGVPHGRNIGDEYRYVLERRNQKKYPGNMPRGWSYPELPWGPCVSLKLVSRSRLAAISTNRRVACNRATQRPRPFRPLPEPNVGRSLRLRSTSTSSSTLPLLL